MEKEQIMLINMKTISFYFLRLSIAGSYLSAVADRFGLWGKSGDPGVVWGNFQNFNIYTETLIFFFQKNLFLFFH